MRSMVGTTVFLSLLSVAAIAAETPIRVEIPRAKQAQAELRSIQTASAERASLSLGMSSWRPESIDLSSYGNNSSTLHSDGLAATFVSLTFPAFYSLATDFSWKSGLRLVPLKRKATIESGGGSVFAQQSVAVFSALAGIEAKPRISSWQGGFSYLSFEVLPTLVVARRSLLSDDQTASGIPAEMALGTYLSLRNVAVGLPESGVDLSVAQSLANPAVFRVSGVAFRAAIRLVL